MSSKHLFWAYLIVSHQQLVKKLHKGGFGPFSILGTHFFIEILPKNRDNGVFTRTPKIRNLSNLAQNFFVSSSTCIKDVYKFQTLISNPKEVMIFLIGSLTCNSTTKASMQNHLVNWYLI